ncbi:MAG TPA: chloramphenicol acetyltransferase [Anaerolineales bacterium]|nr:chloramphenicol acetyltransferase [Anaerolineales bacterium]
MNKIDLQTWSRSEYYEFFNTFNHPHFNMCANIDVTRFRSYIKDSGYSFTIGIVYLISRTSNDIPEFRYRIRENEIVVHDLVSPSITILVGNDLFSFCSIDYSQDFREFAARAARQIAEVKNNPTLKDPPGRDDLLYMTSIPWVSFTSFTHPMRQHPADSIPRFAWGKIFAVGGREQMPLSVQGHHAVMDGIHIGKYYELIQDYLERPEAIFGSES